MADLDFDWRRIIFAQTAAAQFKTFCTTYPRIITLDDSKRDMRPDCLLSVRKLTGRVRPIGGLAARATFKQIDNCVRDYFFSHVHGERERLQNKIIAVAINDHPWKPVALAPDDATKLCIHISPQAVFRRLRNPAFEEIQVEVLFSPRETARNDLRFRIINRAADQMILAVFE